MRLFEAVVFFLFGVTMYRMVTQQRYDAWAAAVIFALVVVIVVVRFTMPSAPRRPKP